MKKLYLIVIIVLIFAFTSSAFAIDFDKQWKTFDEGDCMEKLMDPGYIPWEDLSKQTKKFNGDETLVTGTLEKVLNDKEAIAAFAFSDPRYPDSVFTNNASIAYFKIRTLGTDPLPKDFLNYKPGNSPIFFDALGRIKGIECGEYLKTDTKICLPTIVIINLYNVPLGQQVKTHLAGMFV